jgi:hypothetical protein
LIIDSDRNYKNFKMSDDDFEDDYDLDDDDIKEEIGDDFDDFEDDYEDYSAEATNPHESMENMDDIYGGLSMNTVDQLAESNDSRDSPLPPPVIVNESEDEEENGFVQLDLQPIQLNYSSSSEEEEEEKVQKSSEPVTYGNNQSDNEEDEGWAQVGLTQIPQTYSSSSSEDGGKSSDQSPDYNTNIYDQNSDTDESDHEFDMKKTITLPAEVPATKQEVTQSSHSTTSLPFDFKKLGGAFSKPNSQSNLNKPVFDPMKSSYKGFSSGIAAQSNTKSEPVAQMNQNKKPEVIEQMISQQKYTSDQKQQQQPVEDQNAQLPYPITESRTLESSNGYQHQQSISYPHYPNQQSTQPQQQQQAPIIDREVVEKVYSRHLPYPQNEPQEIYPPQRHYQSTDSHHVNQEFLMTYPPPPFKPIPDHYKQSYRYNDEVTMSVDSNHHNIRKSHHIADQEYQPPPALPSHQQRQQPRHVPEYVSVDAPIYRQRSQFEKPVRPKTVEAPVYRQEHQYPTNDRIFKKTFANQHATSRGPAFLRDEAMLNLIIKLYENNEMLKSGTYNSRSERYHSAPSYGRQNAHHRSATHSNNGYHSENTQLHYRDAYTHHRESISQSAAVRRPTYNADLHPSAETLSTMLFQSILTLSHTISTKERQSILYPLILDLLEALSQANINMGNDDDEPPIQLIAYSGPTAPTNPCYQIHTKLITCFPVRGYKNLNYKLDYWVTSEHIQVMVVVCAKLLRIGSSSIGTNTVIPQPLYVCSGATSSNRVIRSKQSVHIPPIIDEDIIENFIDQSDIKLRKSDQGNSVSIQDIRDALTETVSTISILTLHL